YVRTHLIGFDLEGIRSGQDLLAVVSQKRFDTLNHERMPLDHMWSQLGCSPRYSDAGTLLDYWNFRGTRDNEATAGVRFRKADLGGPAQARLAKFGVYVVEKDARIVMRSDYLMSLFNTQGVKGTLEDLGRVALALAAKPELSLSALENTVELKPQSAS